MMKTIEKNKEALEEATNPTHPAALIHRQETACKGCLGSYLVDPVPWGDKR